MLLDTYGFVGILLRLPLNYTGLKTGSLVSTRNRVVERCIYYEILGRSQCVSSSNSITLCERGVAGEI